VADEVELPASEEQVVRVHPPRLLRVASHRVVVEEDRLPAEDRRLDLGQALGQVAPARARRDGERDGALLGGGEGGGLAPRELLEGQPQRLGVRELAVEQREGGAQRAALRVRELDGRQVEVLRREGVALRLEVRVHGLLDLELDPERLELGTVGVEAAGERVLVHAGVALDLLADLEGGDRPSLRHEERDEGELADELLGVLGHGTSIRGGA
jgi:hypothetical protein